MCVAEVDYSHGRRRIEASRNMSEASNVACDNTSFSRSGDNDNEVSRHGSSATFIMSYHTCLFSVVVVVFFWRSQPNIKNLLSLSEAVSKVSATTVT